MIPHLSCLVATVVLGRWKELISAQHYAVESGRIVQKADVHHTVGSFYITSLVHTAEDVKCKCAVNAARKGDRTTTCDSE